jgi:hypothetical protein
MYILHIFCWFLSLNNSYMNGSRREKFFEMIEKARRRNRKVSRDTIKKDIEEAVRYAKEQEKMEAHKSRGSTIDNSR